MSIVHNFKDRFFGFKMTPKPWPYRSFWQSYERLWVHTLETVNSRKTFWKFIYLFAWMVWNSHSI